MGEMSRKIVFMGSDGLAAVILESLAVSYSVVAVYTQPDKPAGRGRAISVSPAKKLALEKNLEVVQPATLKTAGAIVQLATFAPEVVVVAAYGQILPAAILKMPPYGCVNVHPSLLPKHRGPSPVADALLAGDQVTGVSIALMEAKVDAGPVLAKEEVSVLPEDTTGSLTERLARVGARLLEFTLPHWFLGEIQPLPQDHSQATYSRLITKADGKMNWTLSVAELERRVRAFEPWPASYTSWEGRALKVLAARALSGKLADDAGRVVTISKESGMSVGVQTGAGILELVTVQLEGRRPVSAADFLRGQRNFAGTLLT